MKKLFKILSMTIIILVLLLVVGGILLTVFIKPEHFKPMISQQVKSATGRSLAINGKMSWTFFPKLGLDVNQVVFGNAKGFGDTPFATVEVARVSVEVLPLLKGAIKTDELMLNGATIHLIKNKNGQANWQDLVKRKKSRLVAESSEKTTARKTKFTLHIPKVVIRNAMLTWDNQQKRQHAKITKFNFSADHIQDQKSFPIKSSFKLQSNQPAVQGKISLSGKARFDLDRNKYNFKDFSFNASLVGDSLPNKKLEASLQADILATENAASIDSLRLTLNDTNVTGRFDLNNFDKMVGDFDLKVDQFDVDQWVAKPRKSSGTQPTSTRAKQSKGSASQNKFLRTLQLKGKVSIGRLIAMRLKTRAVKATIKMQDGVINILPMSAQLYRGGFNGAAVLNLQNTNMPGVKINGNLNHIDMQPLLTDLANYKKFLSVANMQINVNTRGASGGALTRNLNGRLQFNLKNGVLKGVDVAHLIRSARAVIKKQLPPKRVGENQTNFGDLTGTATIRNGVLFNKDLKLTSSAAVANGAGTVNLVNQTLDYLLKASPIKERPEEKTFIVPIKISGKLHDPKVRLDTAELLKSVIQQQLERSVIKEKIQEGVKKQLEKIKLKLF